MARYNMDNRDYVIVNGDEVSSVVVNGTEMWSKSEAEMNLVTSNNWSSYSTSGNFGRRYYSTTEPEEGNNLLEIEMPEETSEKFPLYIRVEHRGLDDSAFGSDDYSQLEVVAVDPFGSTPYSNTIENTTSSYQEDVSQVDVQMYMAYVQIYAHGASGSYSEFDRRIRNIEVEYTDGTVVNVFA